MAQNRIAAWIGQQSLDREEGGWSVEAVSAPFKACPIGPVPALWQQIYQVAYERTREAMATTARARWIEPSLN